jgi:hypothetical protein
MKRVLVALGFSVVAMACSLNPQPFPPDNPDAAQGLTDASKGNDGSTFGDATGGVPDSGTDGEPPPESDGGDAGDASDALLDAPIDAPLDAIGDVVILDGTTAD